MTYTSWSYWRHALFSWSPFKRLLADVGAAYLILEVADFFRIFPKEQHSIWTLIVILLGAVFHVLYTVRPVKTISYKPRNRDLCFVVRVGDMLSCPGEIVISTSTTFDTDIASGLISQNSLQGQFANKFFEGKTDDLDKQLTRSLKDVESEGTAVSRGKSRRYPVGTVAKVHTHGQNFYFLAMSEFNEHGNASSTPAMIDTALAGLWRYMAA